MEKVLLLRKKNYDTKRHQNCYSYIVKRNDDIKLLEDIYPYLIIPTKKSRAQLILLKYKAVTPRNGRYSEEMLKSKIDFYNEFISIK